LDNVWIRGARGREGKKRVIQAEASSFSLSNDHSRERNGGLVRI